MTAVRDLPIKKPRAASIYEVRPSLRGIGIVGAGAIVEAAHLPAYQKAQFPVRAIFDIDHRKAGTLASKFGIPSEPRTLDELLDNDSIEVIDIAVPPAFQPEIARRAIAKRKHLLCQKPLADSTTAAEELAKAAGEAGVTLAVNVNMRWDPAMRESDWYISRGLLGDLRCSEFLVRYREEWSSWPWLANGNRLLILYDTIHIIDIIRKFFGKPDQIEASCRVGSDHRIAGETAACIRFAYADGRTVSIETESDAAGPVLAEFSFSGTKALIRGNLGIYYDYPNGRTDTCTYSTHRELGQEDHHTVFEERWIPDAFAGTMAELLSALGEHREPRNSGADHIETLRLIDRIYAACAPIAGRELCI